MGRAATMTTPYITGIDGSKWQGPIDWTKVAGAGHRFAFVRSTYGATDVDPRFSANWAGARDAGLARGAYHFAYVSKPIMADARAEANLMAATVGPARAR
jgi:lysozyme